MSELRINISNLSEGTHTYDLGATAKEVGLDDRFSGQVAVHAELQKTNRQILLKAHVDAHAQFACDRCLEPFHREIVQDYSIVYVVGAQATPGAKEGEIQPLPVDADHIDLDEDVRQFTLLSIPQKLLCRENCAGLCPICGTNWNTATCACRQESGDSRWEALRKLQKN